VSATAVYPVGRAARDRFVLARRGPRAAVDPWAPPRVVLEREPDGHGGVVDVTTLFLTGRECPWRCVMCDLWQHTTEADTPPGAIPQQVRAGLRAGPRPGTVRRNLKLYNAGSFFDPRAVPRADDPAIARAVADFARVTVESHPRLVGDRTWRFRDLLARARGGGRDGGPALEVAMGLETAHPDALARLNKGCTVDEFSAAAAALAAHGVDLRVFLLVHPPFVPHGDRIAWLRRSIDVALDAGASAISLIPTRGDSGAMPALAAQGAFVAPTLAELETSAAEALDSVQSRWQILPRIPGRGPARSPARILADLWDLAAVAACGACLEARRARLLRQNLEQRIPDPVACAACGAPAAACP
jgi:radical SAM enzyme (TIGR01210 family)